MHLLRWLPTYFLIIIVLFMFIALSLFFGFVGWVTICSIIILMLLCIFLAQLVFPRIVVTIKETIEEFDDLKKVVFYADGKKVYEKQNNKISLPTQFTFQIWQRGKYNICMELHYASDKKNAFIEEVNTYEHRVCNVLFKNLKKMQ